MAAPSEEGQGACSEAGGAVVEGQWWAGQCGTLCV